MVYFNISQIKNGKNYINYIFQENIFLRNRICVLYKNLHDHKHCYWSTTEMCDVLIVSVTEFLNTGLEKYLMLWRSKIAPSLHHQGKTLCSYKLCWLQFALAKNDIYWFCCQLAIDPNKLEAKMYPSKFYNARIAIEFDHGYRITRRKSFEW